MKDWGKNQFNPEQTWLFPPQKWQEGLWVATAWRVWKTGGDGYYKWYKRLSRPVSLPLVFHFQKIDRAFCSQSYKGQSILLGKEKHLSRGSGRMLVRIKAAIGQVSQDPLLPNAGSSQGDRCGLAYDADTRVGFDPQLLITFYDFI